MHLPLTPHDLATFERIALTRRHSPHDERAELRRLHREQVAAVRARARQQPPPVPLPMGVVLCGPAAAILVLLFSPR
jgi:hypothetical protein